MKNIFCTLLFLPALLNAQTIIGIQFQQDLSWPQIQEKARSENKYIFVDCYATWCGPCKWMDKEIYTNDTIGELMNAKFVCVKVQMDSTAKDNDQIRKWYSIAHDLQNQYKIRGYPSYLFFSPDGRAVHKDLGSMDVKRFLELAHNALNPRSQYYTLLDTYNKGEKDFRVMPFLSNQALGLKEDSIAWIIAEDYMHHYLANLAEKDFCTKDNFTFIGGYAILLKPEDKLFEYYLRNQQKIDSIVGIRDYSDRVINQVIYKEEIYPPLHASENGGPEPEWDRMEEAIRRKFGSDYVDRNVVSARVEYYQSRKDWKDYTKYLIQEVEGYGIQHLQAGFLGAVYLNNRAWAVFQYSKNKKELEKALSWADQALSMLPKPRDQEIDTKANLLYKLGKKQQGIVLEKQAIVLSPNNRNFQEELGIMEKGLPTWPSL